MPIVYDNINNIFQEEEIITVAGTITGVSQVFYANKFVSIGTTASINNVFTFDSPQFYTTYGSTNYYQHDQNAIIVEQSVPCMAYTFTSNTKNFTALTITCDVYKLDYPTWDSYLNCVNSSGSTTQSCNKNEVINKLTNPILIYTAATTLTNVTNSTVTISLYLNEFEKQLGQSKERVFEDKSQYFVNVGYGFYRPINKIFDNIQYYNNGVLVTTGATTQEYEFNYATAPQIISASTMMGTSVNGEFFTYMLMPNQPNLEDPIVSGLTTTYTPVILFSNVEDGDEYVVQISYTPNDVNFSGTSVQSYNIPKDSINKTNTKYDSETQIGDNGWTETIDTVDQTIIHIFSFPLKPPVGTNSAIYRIGNVKEITNIFNVTQKVISFSDIQTIQIPVTDPPSFINNVYVESDSPYISNIDIPTQRVNMNSNCYAYSGQFTGGTVSI